MARIEIPKLDTKHEVFEFLKENKELHFKEKKSSIKHADYVSHVFPVTADKANPKPVSAEASEIRVKSVINTTNIMDSHLDVHIKGLWKKSLRENKDLVLLQEHKMNFSHVISEEVKAFTEIMDFKAVGFPRLKMDTEALIFNSVINKDRNEFMFNLYSKALVKQHSVGMQYVKLLLAINSDSSEFKEEKEVWDKYISEVANAKDAENRGFFWPVLEAKAIEGSAVVRGSNPATPTQEIEEIKDIEAGSTTSKDEPPAGTHDHLHLY